jgi:iron(III) transport system permease protein
MVPAVAAVTGWAFLLSPKVGYLNELLRLLPPLAGRTDGPFDIYSFPGIVFVTGLILTSFMYLFAHNGLRTTGGEYEDAAAVSGASPARTFLTITLPQLRPSLVYGTGITFMLSLGQFAAPLLLGGPAHFDVLTTRMFSLLQGYPVPFGQAAALGAPLLAAGAVVLLAQRVLIGDVRRYVTAGGRLTHSPRQPSSLAAIVVGVYAALAVVLPLLALIYVALSPYWSGKLAFDKLSLRNFQRVLVDNPYLSGALVTSVESIAVTIIIVLPVGYLLARFLAGRREAPQTVIRLLDLLVLLPYGTPAVLFGFALLFAYTRPPFVLYGTTTIIVVAYATIMVPYATRLQLATLMSLGEEPWEAARVSGAGPLRLLWSVTIPLMRRGASAAGAVIAVLLFQEFGVSLMVRSANVQVVGSVLYDQYEGGLYPFVAVLALAMVAITAAGVAVVMLVGGADALSRSGGGARVDG